MSLSIVGWIGSAPFFSLSLGLRPRSQERSPLTNVSRVRFLDPASYVGWVCCWFSPSLLGFSPGSPVFLPPQKSTFLNPNSIGNSRATGLSVEDCYVLPMCYVLNKVNFLFMHTQPKEDMCTLGTMPNNFTRGLQKHKSETILISKIKSCFVFVSLFFFL